MERKKKTVIISTVLSVMIIFILLLFYQFIYKDMKIRNQINLIFHEDNLVVEYGKEMDPKTFIKETEGEVTTYPIMDSKMLGKQDLIYIVEKDGVSKEITYTIEVKDTREPVIIFSAERVEINQDGDFNPSDYIKEVKDPVDGEIPFSESVKDTNYYVITTTVDIATIGSYEIQVKAVDINGNEAQATLTVNVVERATGDTVVGSGSKIQPTYINGILLVNKTHGLPADFGGLDNTAYSALLKLQAGAAVAGYEMPMLSGYRSYAYQADLYNRYVERDGQEAADRYSARPGYSEHQTGLCFDVGAVDDEYGSTAAGKWLAKHAHEYGFIIRFPEGKENITGYTYEPWHVRHVGESAAKMIYESSVTLEEYLGVD